MEVHLLPILSSVCPKSIRVGETLSRVEANMGYVFIGITHPFTGLMLNTNKYMEELYR